MSDSRSLSSPPSAWTTAAVFSGLTALVALSLHDFFSADRVPIYRDLLYFVLPAKKFLSDQLRQGNFPLWNPWVYMGTPFLASLQTGVFYPPSLLFLLPFPLAFNVFILAHFAIALAGSFALLRHLRLSLPAVAVGSLTFVLGGYLISTVNLTNHFLSACWAPFVLLAWLRFLHTSSVPRLLLTSLALSLQLLAGSPETVLMTLAAATALTAASPPFHLKSLLFRFAALGAALLLTALLTAFQSLPTLEYLQHSSRAHGLELWEVKRWSLAPLSLLQLLFPHSSSFVLPEETGTLGPLLENEFAWLQSLYLGAGALIFATAGVVSGRRRAAWIGIASIGLAISFGGNTPLLGWAYDVFPELISRFRYPEKLWFLVHLAVAVLAAEGADAISRRSTNAHRALRASAVTIGAVGAVAYASAIWWPHGLVTAIAVLTASPGPAIAFTAIASDLAVKGLRLAIISGALFVLLSLFHRKRIGLGTAGICVAAVVAADLGGVHRGLNLSHRWSVLAAPEQTRLDVDRLRSEQSRIFHYQTVRARGPSAGSPVRGLDRWEPRFHREDDLRRLGEEHWSLLLENVGMVYGVGSLSSWDGIRRQSSELVREALRQLPRDRAIRFLRSLGVRFLIGPAPLDDSGIALAPRASGEGVFVYEIPSPAPFARLADHLVVEPSIDRSIELLASRSFEPSSTAIVSSLPKGWNPASSSGPIGTVEVVERGPDRVVVDADVTRKALLVVSESVFPGWKASVDGSSVEVLAADAFFRAVVLEPGRHRIRFDYSPASFRAGLWISLLAAVASLLAWAFRPAERLG